MESSMYATDLYMEWSHPWIGLGGMTVTTFLN